MSAGRTGGGPDLRWPGRFGGDSPVAVEVLRRLPTGRPRVSAAGGTQAQGAAGLLPQWCERRYPAGCITPEGWAGLDCLGPDIGDGTLRLTTRQGVQYHAVAKADLVDLVGEINPPLG